MAFGSDRSSRRSQRRPRSGLVLAAGLLAASPAAAQTLPTFSISSPSVTEGDAGTTATMTFTITLSSNDRFVQVDYATTGGGATSGVDYTAASGTLTFETRDTSESFDVSITGDDLDELDETVQVVLTNPVNASLGGSTQVGSGTITDDDTATLSFDGSPSTGEGGELIYSVTLGNFGRTVTVNYADTGKGTATSGTDYTAITAGTVTFRPTASGTLTQELPAVTTLDDTKDEPDETVILRLTSPGITRADGSVDGAGTIQDDDPAPSVGIGSASVSEGDSGNTTVNLPVTLSAASGRTVTVKYADAGTGSATSGTDYQAITAGTLTFAARRRRTFPSS